MNRISKIGLNDAPALIHVATQIFLYRSADDRAFDGSAGHFEKIEWQQSQLVYFDVESLARQDYPLRYHIILTCIAPKSFQWLQFRKSGHTQGWGQSLETDWQQVIQFLIEDFRLFPRNFISSCIGSEPSFMPAQLSKGALN